MPSGLISTSCGSISARRISAASLGKGSALSPWKDRVQSIFSSGAFSSSSGLSSRPVLEMVSAVGRCGTGAVVRFVGVSAGMVSLRSVEGGVGGVWVVWYCLGV